jgi:Glycine/sarcosine/betaine reductase component B subunits
MRLELAWSDVDEVTAGPATRLVGKRLEVDLDGLRELLSADSRLARIRLDLAHPGERCRIGRVFDVIAPRAKADGSADFPGSWAAWREPATGKPWPCRVWRWWRRISRRTTSARSR